MIKYDQTLTSLNSIKRDEEGFLDLNNINLKITSTSKEKMGNQNRLKNWVKFNQDQVLLKGEIKLEEEGNYGYYAELLAEELGKYYGLEMASYDLIKYQHEKGVITPIMYEEEKEKLVSLYDLVGKDDQTTFLDATDYNYVMTSLKKVLDINTIRQWQKQLAFSLLILDTDNHIQNYSFIKNDDTYRISPKYDNEACLLLDNDKKTIAKILDDYQSLINIANIAQPRIGLYHDEEDGGFGNYWMDTLEALIIDDEIYDFCLNVLLKPIDMEDIFKKVEQKIHAPLPQDVKYLAKYAFKSRRQTFSDIIKGNI